LDFNCPIDVIFIYKIYKKQLLKKALPLLEKVASKKEKKL